MSIVSAARRPVTRTRAPVFYWASAGALLITVELILLARWVTGPDFVRVPTGATAPPEWMKVALSVGQIGFVIACALMFYRFLYRPWRRERTLTIDGILCVGFLLAAFFDPLSNYWHNWWGYNSYLVNFGSVMSAIPGGTAGNGRGTGQAFSVLLVPSGYVVVFVLCSILGSRIMRAAKQRWPRLNAAALIALCLVSMMAIDILVEGMFFLRLGFWSYAGGRGALLSPSHYYKYPVQVLIGSGIFFSVGPCIRYFVNDRGETLGERGIGTLKLSAGKRAAMRALAVIATLHIALLLLYHIPQALLARDSAAWPRDALSRTYFTHGQTPARSDPARVAAASLRPGRIRWQ